MKILILFVFLFISSTSSLILSLLESIYGQYLQQGIPFRENTFLNNKPILREYDFVIIGAGPGGSVVANRLSEQSNWTVLVLEAGQDESIYTDIPGAAEFLASTDYNWGYTAEPAKNGCFSFKNNRCPWPKGKGMGGSSIINYMLYTRGKKEDYDTISGLGNSGWAYKDVLPYFLKAENNSIPEYKNSSFHSQKGNLHVERTRYHSPLMNKFIEAGGELGLQQNIDYTVNPVDGVSRIQATTLNGHRVSASKAYIRSVKHRQNLHVAIFSRVKKILIDPQTKKTIGVEFVKKGKNRMVYARKEVILSAGPINSPQLLMLSGIGPNEQLQKLNIPVIQDLPVGQNLLDHYGTIALQFTVNQTGPAINKGTIMDPYLFQEWFKYGRGPLVLPGGVDGLAYAKSPSGKEIELIFAPVGPTPNSFMIATLMLQPDGRGNVTLRNKNPWNPPLMSYGYYETKTDLDANVYALKYAVKLVEETQAFKDVDAKLDPAPYPKCSHLLFKSDDYWACVSKYLTNTYHHQCGTCRMGDVVNNKLQVIGIQGLRVVDSSIFPHIPHAHLYSPTLMVGEKASDMIKSFWL
ncbi:Glucose-methanol-choline oxidoreductase, C-terminal,Glucose-methanol-choline oxidoreductase, N- [Cinara cedri]|uniref:Glucose-methanol-choline oxidoreductase, C-terminal,Glucose-methanol-choline oxidoreductase, N n=1 Tax=Cinara cedri TaxID=506608 RepID=A0A5E4MLH4_9HEMI|nr:Glucose-methanol-choline oxidoreductase, C-terminal,Glucose-methanol-choline oxidoreductase, N- [Cinara cedri]